MPLRIKPRPMALASLAIALSGCNSYTTIKPTEVPKLNGHFATRAAAADLVLLEVHVQQEDGEVLKIDGPFDLRVTLRDGTEFEFEHPVATDREDGRLLLSGPNRGWTSIPLSRVESVEVIQEGSLSPYVSGVVLVVGVVALLLV